MDPEATLRMAEQLMDCQPRESLDLLSHYWQWRKKLGFEPEDGDNRAKAIGAVCRRHTRNGA